MDVLTTLVAVVLALVGIDLAALRLGHRQPRIRSATTTPAEPGTPNRVRPIAAGASPMQSYYTFIALDLARERAAEATRQRLAALAQHGYGPRRPVRRASPGRARRRPRGRRPLGAARAPRPLTHDGGPRSDDPGLGPGHLHVRRRAPMIRASRASPDTKRDRGRIPTGVAALDLDTE